jgi:hypothetical protein
LLRLDLDLDRALAGEAAQQCDRCEGFTYDVVCPCTPDRILDPAERLRLRAEAGVPISDAELAELYAPRQATT